MCGCPKILDKKKLKNFNMKKGINYISSNFKLEYRLFKNDRKSWFKNIKSDSSQFGIEVNPEPDKATLRNLGRLIWCSSLFEEKLSMTIFWLSSLIEGELVGIP